MYNCLLYNNGNPEIKNFSAEQASEALFYIDLQLDLGGDCQEKIKFIQIKGKIIEHIQDLDLRRNKKQESSLTNFHY